VAPALIALALLAAPAAHAGDRVEDQFALTISGGVSLGAYEAGLNWALVQFLRLHVRELGTELRALLRARPALVGITGASAGGHLSLMQGTAGTAGNPDAKDPIDRVSSRVQAVACFFPPTDFLNYGKTGEIALGTGVLSGFRAPFDFK